jgi:hypothetical protein
MRSLRPIVVLLAVALVSCAPPPKIEGHVSSVSPKDIQEIIALVQRDMVKDFWHVVPIDRIEVRAHNNVAVYYQNENNNYTVPLTRVHGVWSLPRVMVTG